MNLKEYISEHPCQGFKAVPHYNKIGNFIELYWEDVDCYSETLNGQVTLIKATNDSRVVGVKIYKAESFIK